MNDDKGPSQSKTRPKVYRCDGQMCAMASQVNKMQDYVQIMKYLARYLNV